MSDLFLESRNATVVVIESSKKGHDHAWLTSGE